ncbi:MAG: DUF1501 domain-containing protein, partial [Gammaproteobacteria bacterium]|nr:DUF1501 domain-containing protein [Gammaproteobacteria bacterium]
MKRRDFLKQSFILGAAGLIAPVPKVYSAPADGYSGRLLVTLQVDGGWDVTSFCDPKMNVAGEQDINNWANTAEIQTAGNLSYAPFADNAAFFDKYYQDMLIINGVDAQTNSHSTGVLHNWSGRNSSGYPSITAMFAAHNAPDQPLSYINSGGFAYTADLIRFSRLEDADALRQLLVPEKESDEVYIRSPSDMERIREYRNQRHTRLLSDPTIINRYQENLAAYDSALQSKSSLSDFENFIPANEDIQPNEMVTGNVNSDLKRQMQMTIAAFSGGICSSADLFTRGYDTHANHDALHASLFSHLADSIDFFWTSAEDAGLADRITLLIGSDFGRTPNYNSDMGKDHWPIGS